MNNRKFKNNILLLFLLILLGLGTGYAYLNSSLYINGTSIISANVWDVGLDNLNISTGSVVAISEPVINDTESTFSVKLENQDDFFEFTFDVVNNGDYDAKLGSLIETTGLTEEQEQYFDYTFAYQNNESIQVNQLIKKDEFVRLKSRVEYKETVNVVSVPESAKTLNLGFSLNYDLDDGSGIVVKDNGVYDFYKIGSEICFDTECFYVISSDNNTVTLLSKYNLYVGNECSSSISSSCRTYGDEATGKQDYRMLGYVYGQTLRKGTMKFSNDMYWSPSISDAKNVYNENSVLYTYVENYKSFLEKLGLEVYEARVIHSEELENLGCILSTNCYEGCTCIGAPNWVYSTSYWTGISYFEPGIWIVRSDGMFCGWMVSNDYDLGLRPVIVVPKSEIVDNDSGLIKNVIEFTIDGVKYEAKEGMTWREWVNSEYNVDNYILGECKMNSNVVKFYDEEFLVAVDSEYIIRKTIEYEFSSDESDPASICVFKS